MKQVLLFEYISGGGMGNSADFEFLIAEGFGMLSSLITDFIQLGFSVQVLIDVRVRNRVIKKFQYAIRDHKLTFETISNEKELSPQLQTLVPNSDYVLLIAPEFLNILYDLVSSIESILQPHQILLNFPSKAIYIFTNKLKTEQFIRSLGFSAPKSFLVNETFTFPHQHCILKPVDGAGSVDTFWIFTKNEVERNQIVLAILNKSPQQNFIVQQKIQGIPLSAFIACNQGKITFITFNFQSIEYTSLDELGMTKQLGYNGGYTPFTNLSSEVEKAIHDLAIVICSQFQLTGFMGIDFLYDKSSNSYSIVDINPRVTTPYIAISALFKENKSNLLQCLFSSAFKDKIRGKKTFMKSKQNEIVLN